MVSWPVMVTYPLFRLISFSFHLFFSSFKHIIQFKRHRNAYEALEQVLHRSYWFLNSIGHWFFRKMFCHTVQVRFIIISGNKIRPSGIWTESQLFHKKKKIWSYQELPPKTIFISLGKQLFLQLLWHTISFSQNRFLHWKLKGKNCMFVCTYIVISVDFENSFSGRN